MNDDGEVDGDGGQDDYGAEQKEACERIRLQEDHLAAVGQLTCEELREVVV